MTDEEVEKYFEDKCGTYFETTKAEIKEDVCNAFKDGYNKANEWHFVKDGEYPTHEKDVQVLYQDCDKIKVYNCVYDVQAKNWLYHNLDNMVLELFPFTVNAWKEIVLPLKESKEC